MMIVAIMCALAATNSNVIMFIEQWLVSPARRATRCIPPPTPEARTENQHNGAPYSIGTQLVA
jgi:hypothetical protein